jgi:aspartyl/glutamyl-tRNA(Asn/Gln) amidotransferase C subunit
MTDVKHLAKLANLSPDPSLIPALQSGVETTLEYAKILGQVDVSHVGVTNEITGLTNVLRDDIVDDSRTFTQAEALANAGKSHNGFFMVDAILE